MHCAALRAEGTTPTTSGSGSCCSTRRTAPAASRPTGTPLMTPTQCIPITMVTTNKNMPRPTGTPLPSWRRLGYHRGRRSSCFSSRRTHRCRAAHRASRTSSRWGGIRSNRTRSCSARSKRNSTTARSTAILCMTARHCYSECAVGSGQWAVHSARRVTGSTTADGHAARAPEPPLVLTACCACCPRLQVPRANTAGRDGQVEGETDRQRRGPTGLRRRQQRE